MRDVEESGQKRAEGERCGEREKEFSQALTVPATSGMFMAKGKGRSKDKVPAKKKPLKKTRQDWRKGLTSGRSKRDPRSVGCRPRRARVRERPRPRGR